MENSLRRTWIKMEYRLGWRALPQAEVFVGQPYAVEFDHLLAKRKHIDYASTLVQAEQMARSRCLLAVDGQARVHTTTADGELGEKVGFYAEVGSYRTWYKVDEREGVGQGEGLDEMGDFA
jgi:hypothetical protein